ncbi:MAG: 4-hydroxy-tetrahydrodipicolinate synthase [Myxococcales bacterium]|nr:4-hydroxy-tetrahydrodipicolinate synthase [Myxococcota bacterium]MDW8280833.1 4-hydroxy-tetrahydrodipicolinate synthase [Myxococcales bacterium]
MSTNPSTAVRIQGALTALVTPMRREGDALVVDEQALGDLCEAQIRAGIDGLVPCGTTGEAATLSAAEQERVIRLVVEAAAGRVPVVAGVGSNSTAHALELARAAARAGAQALLVVTPYYNKPTQEGLLLHYRELARVGVPLVLYNVPGRTGCDLLPETVARLCELPEVIAIKEATGSVQRTQQIIARMGDRLTVLSGEDAINYPLYCVGARGCISVVGNIAPELTAAIWDATVLGDHVRARSLHYQFLPLAEAMFLESNPIPVKTALARMGRIQPWLRPPLCPMSPGAEERMLSAMRTSGLL